MALNTSVLETSTFFIFLIMYTRPCLTRILAILMFALSLCHFNGCSGSGTDTESQDEEEISDTDSGKDSKSGSKDKSGTNKGKNDITVEVSKGSFKDRRDGKTYSTVTIDGHTWMAENLDYSKGLDSTVQRPYGTAYLLKEAKKACPDGWHLPSVAEWRELIKSVSKDFNYDEAWALKSKTGWISDGNGGDVYGFNVQPGGRGYNGESFGEYEDISIYFWTSSDSVTKNDVEWMAFYFDKNNVGIDLIGYQKEVSYLFVRCISDINSAFGAFGQCDDARKGELNMLDSVYYICTERRDWDRATTQQYLNHEYGECNESNSDYENNGDVIEINKGIYNDTAFVCKCRRPDYRLNECQWYHGTSKDALPPCANNGSKTITTYLDSTFTCYSDTWRPSKVEDVYSECNAEKNGQIVSLNSKKYTCYNPTWREMIMPDSAIGICNAERSWTTYTRKIVWDIPKSYQYQSFVCEYEYWRLFTPIEDELGYCETDGEKGDISGYTFECDASKHRWFTTFTDERDGNKYRAVIVRDHLWMAEDLRYGGKSHYTWSEALDIPLENDTLFWTNAIDADSVGICPDGWHIPKRKEWEYIANAPNPTENLGSLFEAGNPQTTPGRDSYGLSLVLDQGDTVKSSIRTEKDAACESSMRQSGEYGKIVETICSRQVGGEPAYYHHYATYWSTDDIVELRSSTGYHHNVASFSEILNVPDGPAYNERELSFKIIDDERTTPRPIRCMKAEYISPVTKTYPVEEE